MINDLEKSYVNEELNILRPDDESKYIYSYDLNIS